MSILKNPWLFAILSPAVVILLAGCTGLSSATSPTEEESSPVDPTRGAVAAATASPNEGVTRPPETASLAPATPVANGYELETLVELPDLNWMLGFEVLPGGTEALIITKTGQIWRASLSEPAPPLLAGDISDRLIALPHVEEGLLGQALSPGFETDGRVYLHYTSGEPRRSVLSRFTMAGGTLDTASEEVLLEVPQPFANHNGGHIAFGPDGYLYMALGDGGDAFDPQGTGQNLGDLLSSILRIDVSGDSGYTVPGDNPFAGQAGVRPEIYAYGLRNPWRFSFDRETGALWAGDVGQDVWEEINRIEAGGNYGWSAMEGSLCNLRQGCDVLDTLAPRALHARESNNQAIVGGYVYRGSAMPELDGWLVYGDWGLGKIWALNTYDSSAPVTLVDTDVPIMSFGQLPDGEIVIVAFSGGIYKLTRP